MLFAPRLLRKWHNGSSSHRINPRHRLTELFAHLPGAHRSWWEQEQIHRNKNPFPTLSLNAAGKKYHFLRGESICPGLHATENDYTAGEDTFPSKATSPVGCVGEGPGPTQSQGALLQHRESLMDGRIWAGALFLAAIPAFPRKGENSHGASQVLQFLSRVVTDTTTRSHQ